MAVEAALSWSKEKQFMFFSPRLGTGGCGRMNVTEDLKRLVPDDRLWWGVTAHLYYSSVNYEEIICLRNEITQMRVDLPWVDVFPDSRQHKHHLQGSHLLYNMLVGLHDAGFATHSLDQGQLQAQDDLQDQFDALTFDTIDTDKVGKKDELQITFDSLSCMDS